jgi:hypothetical protein
MKVEHRIPYNAMPEATRQRLVDFSRGPNPLMADYAGGTGGRIFKILFGLSCVIGVFAGAAVDFGKTWGYLPKESVYWFAGGLFLGIGCLLSAVRSFWADKAIPWKPGRFLTALDFIDAREAQLRFRPLSQLAGPIRIVDHYTNGIYTGTSMTLNFQGGGSETFSVRGRGKAEAVIDALNEGTRAIRAAVEQGNYAGILQHDPFIELRQLNWQLPSGDTVPEAGPVTKKGNFVVSHPWLCGLAGAAVLCYPIYLVREMLHDRAIYSYLQTSGDKWEMESYISHGGKHSEEVKNVFLPRAEFEDAQRSGSVARLRQFMTEYPKAVQVPEARKLVQQIYAEAREKFHKEAAEDKSLVAAVDALLDWISTNDQTKVPVKFRAPESSLAELDAKLGDPKVIDLPGRTIAPIASHFTSEVSKTRETGVTSLIASGFNAIFPAEVVELEHAGRIAEGLGGQLAGTEVKTPEIEVRYVVEPSGAIYTSRDDKTRAYIGILVTFDVTLRVPGLKAPYTTTFKVEPPATFQVRDQTDASEVYTVMAEKAFEELREKLIVAFFRPGSPAYEQAMRTLQEAAAARDKNEPSE